MKNKYQVYILLIFILSILLSCNFPGFYQPLPSFFTQTPDYKATALLLPSLLASTSTPVGITATLAGMDQTNTQTITMTAVNPIATNSITPTNTDLPGTTRTHTLTPTMTYTRTRTITPSTTYTRTRTLTPTNTLTIIRTLTRTSTQKSTRTATRTSTSIPPTKTRTVTRTVTITPSKTNTRTPTTESSQSRDGLHHKAGYISSFPNLDGHCDEYWTDSYPVSSVVYGGENWNGNDDLSGSVSLGWDEDNLYVCAKINDDDYVQNANGYDIYLGDSLEINLDKNLQDDFDDNNRSSDDYQLGISPGYGDLDGPKEAFVWFPREKAGSRSQVDVGTEDRSGGYRIEAAIPWSIYGISPNTGDRFGFAFSISDNDDRDENVQQSMTSSVAGRKLLNPTTWGELKLVD